MKVKILLLFLVIFYSCSKKISFIKNFDRLLQVSKKEMDIKHNNLTLRRDCRHEVRLFIENESISRKEYIRLKEETVEYVFDTFRFRDDKYNDYLLKYKN